MKRIAGQQDELGAHGCLVLREIRPDRVGGRRDDAELAARYAKLKEMETKAEYKICMKEQRCMAGAVCGHLVCCEKCYASLPDRNDPFENPWWEGEFRVPFAERRRHSFAFMYPLRPGAALCQAAGELLQPHHRPRVRDAAAPRRAQGLACGAEHALLKGKESAGCQSLILRLTLMPRNPQRARRHACVDARSQVRARHDRRRERERERHMRNNNTLDDEL